jgi:hypothetical protein
MSQKPEVQSPSPVHALPSGFCPQVPSTQTPDVHASAPMHGAPSASFAVHVAASQ